jgi:hypothetical protein
MLQIEKLQKSGVKFTQGGQLKVYASGLLLGVALTIISITHPSRSRVSNLLRPFGDGAHAVVHNLATILHFDSSGCRALDSSHNLLFQWPYLSDWFVLQKQQVAGCYNSGCRANYQKNEVLTLVLTHLKKSLHLIQMKKGISPLEHTIVP